MKSGKDYKHHVVLNNVLGTKGYTNSCAYVFSEANVSQGECAGKPVLYLPLYMTMCLVAERRGAGEKMLLPEVSFDGMG